VPARIIYGLSSFLHINAFDLCCVIRFQLTVREQQQISYCVQRDCEESVIASKTYRNSSQVSTVYGSVTWPFLQMGEHTLQTSYKQILHGAKSFLRS
jgi:hypothetical protein